MRKTYIFLFILLFSCIHADAVLKEKDLPCTLSVLRAELERDWKEQQYYIDSYETEGVKQHQLLINYMNQCEQIGLMLYSQTTDNTFDMSYACRQASDLYKEIHGGKIQKLPYDKIISTMKLEMERMQALITSLKSIPPAIEMADIVMTEKDSIMYSVLDSLTEELDTLTEIAILEGEPLHDREVCLELAEKLYANMVKYLDIFEKEMRYYTTVQEKAEKLNDFAQSRYQVLRDNIFTIGDANYFYILKNITLWPEVIRQSFERKYYALNENNNIVSEWRGVSLLFIVAFVLLWLPISLLVSYAFLRWLMPKKWKGENFREKRRMLNSILGVAVFAIIVTVVRVSYDKSAFQMGTEIIINLCWLMEIIFLSLYERLKGVQMSYGARVYLPIIGMAMVVVLFRITLIPNALVSILCPPILLIFTIWQLWEANNHRRFLPALDIIYVGLTSMVMIVSCILSWVGYSLMAVLILIWWTFQFAAITTVSCLHNMMTQAEIRIVARLIDPTLIKRYNNGEEVQSEIDSLLLQMEEGTYIVKTWFFDFMKRAVLPMLALLSIPYCITWSADLFELAGFCMKIFSYNFLDIDGVIQMSIFKLVVVGAMFFIFSWANYTIRSLYIHYRKNLLGYTQEINFTLTKNITAIITWGVYIIISLIILKVPRSGISIITAGLATGMGFAMKDLLENFFYGISLMTGRIRVGDYIECDGISGKVTSITYQSTTLDTLDGCVIAFLNSALFTKNFKNLTQTHPYQLKKLSVGVAYGVTIDQVRSAIIPAIEAACSRNVDIAGNPRPADKPLLDPAKNITVRFDDFGASSVDLLVCMWLRVEETTWLVPYCREIIYNALNKAGIEIPFPQCDVHMK